MLWHNIFDRIYLTADRYRTTFDSTSNPNNLVTEYHSLRLFISYETINITFLSIYTDYWLPITFLSTPNLPSNRIPDSSGSLLSKFMDFVILVLPCFLMTGLQYGVVPERSKPAVLIILKRVRNLDSHSQLNSITR